MSLLDVRDLITIKLYYKLKQIGDDKKLIILDDDKAEKLLQDEKTIKDVEILETKWSSLTWKEQNEVMGAASKNIDPMSGERQFNFVIYRDSIIKRCLRSWNLKADNNAPIPVNAVNIDRLPASIVARLYQKFDSLVNYTEEEVKN